MFKLGENVAWLKEGAYQTRRKMTNRGESEKKYLNHVDQVFLSSFVVITHHSLLQVNFPIGISGEYWVHGTNDNDSIESQFIFALSLIYPELQAHATWSIQVQYNIK